jgi:hypothetical protein
MDRDSARNPWAKPTQIIRSITASIDHDAIERASRAMTAETAGKRKLKGIYFDADVAAALDNLKLKRVNVSGFVNAAVRDWLSRQ